MSEQSLDSVEDRFQFGDNWSRFLDVLNEDRIEQAERSLKEMLKVETLEGLSFLDAGSGSGLFSLAARRLGARVCSFDFDPQSVACTQELKRRYFDEDSRWQIEQGSVLDEQFLERLGRFDIIYSWGVLHHTGSMWIGIENLIERTTDGKIFIAIYNDQGFKSHAWWLIKWLYNKLPAPLNLAYGYTVGFAAKLFVLIKYTALLKPMTVVSNWLDYKQTRGMRITHDMIDWIGGFPFEFARYEVLEKYFELRGFEVVTGKRSGSTGCHELVFQRRSD